MQSRHHRSWSTDGVRIVLITLVQSNSRAERKSHESSAGLRRTAAPVVLALSLAPPGVCDRKLTLALASASRSERDAPKPSVDHGAPRAVHRLSVHGPVRKVDVLWLPSLMPNLYAAVGGAQLAECAHWQSRSRCLHIILNPGDCSGHPRRKNQRR